MSHKRDATTSVLPYVVDCAHSDMIARNRMREGEGEEVGGTLGARAGRGAVAPPDLADEARTMERFSGGVSPSSRLLAGMPVVGRAREAQGRKPESPSDSGDTTPLPATPPKFADLLKELHGLTVQPAWNSAAGLPRCFQKSYQHPRLFNMIRGTLQWSLAEQK